MSRAPHLLLVLAPYYAHIATLLRQGAERALAAAGATCEVVEVPGAFELPPAIALAARSVERFDGYVALGCVIRGETTHYDHICEETARALQDMGVRDGLAIGYGILTVESEAQALVRAAPDGRDKGGESVRACLALIDLKRRFQGGGAVTGADTVEGAPRHGGTARRRSIARLAAVQALYQLELNPGRGADAVIGEFVHHRLGREIDGDVYGEADEELFADIVRGVVADRERLDETLSAALSEEWPLSRLETLLRFILEAGAYELVHRPDIPPRVTMSEYVAIAYAFFDGREPGLANGVLDRLARTLRAADL